LYQAAYCTKQTIRRARPLGGARGQRFASSEKRTEILRDNVTGREILSSGFVRVEEQAIS